MAWLVLDDRRQIKRIIHNLVTTKTVIHVRIDGEETPFTSKFIKINQENVSSRLEEWPDLIIEKLSPEKGNSLIQSVSGVEVEFTVNDNLCRCSLTYKGISSSAPYFGFIVGFPESLKMEEKRKEYRLTHTMPEFVSVEFSLDKGPKKDKVYNLDVIDCSDHGLGLLVTPEDSELIEVLNPGDLLKDIRFYALSAMIEVDGTVRHKTEMKWDKYKGCYMLGIESPEIIENCKPRHSK